MAQTLSARIGDGNETDEQKALGLGDWETTIRRFYHEYQALISDAARRKSLPPPKSDAVEMGKGFAFVSRSGFSDFPDFY
jgi:hypothetical protein